MDSNNEYWNYLFSMADDIAKEQAEEEQAYLDSNAALAAEHNISCAEDKIDKELEEMEARGEFIQPN